MSYRPGKTFMMKRQAITPHGVRDYGWVPVIDLTSDSEESSSEESSDEDLPPPVPIPVPPYIVTTGGSC